VDVNALPNKTVGAMIKQYMLDRGINQSFVSSKTNIPTNTLNFILNSKRRLNAEEYFLICEVLDVPLETFKPELTEVG
jgi:transcriptional regulator with XRE-family HTH domain